MKKYIFLSLLFFAPIFLFSQEPSPQKSFGGMQMGLFNQSGGILYYHEQKISDNFFLRAEGGILSGYANKHITLGTGFAIQPRWYYNTEKRQALGKKTAGNSANYLGIKTFFSFPNNLYSTPNQVSLIFLSDYDKAFRISADWGIRRRPYKSFNWELGVGLGYKYFFVPEIRKNNPPLFINLNLRVGFDLY